MENTRLGKTIRLTGNEVILAGWRSDSNSEYTIIADTMGKAFDVADANGLCRLRTVHGEIYRKLDGEWINMCIGYACGHHKP